MRRPHSWPRPDRRRFCRRRTRRPSTAWWWGCRPNVRRVATWTPQSRSCRSRLRRPSRRRSPGDRRRLPGRHASRSMEAMFLCASPGSRSTRIRRAPVACNAASIGAACSAETVLSETRTHRAFCDQGADPPACKPQTRLHAVEASPAPMASSSRDQISRTAAATVSSGFSQEMRACASAYAGPRKANSSLARCRLGPESSGL